MADNDNVGTAEPQPAERTEAISAQKSSSPMPDLQERGRTRRKPFTPKPDRRLRRR